MTQSGATAPALGANGEALVGKWSLTMAWWSLFSAMFWLYISAASAAAYGPRATLIGLVLTIATYGIVNIVLATYSLHTGLTVESLSQLVFGKIGGTAASLLLAITALYYGVFEGSVIAATLQSEFGGTIKIWYAVCVIYAVPLAFGGVRHWLDRLNGFLLPFYVLGLVALVLAATIKQGYPQGWLTAQVPASTVVPGWLGSYMIFMGVWVMMMFTIDFASLGRASDARFHRRFTFGPLFYACTFGINGLIGIYVVTAFGVGGTETGVVQAVVGSLGSAGVVLIVISQTRINTANYYLASSNFESVVRRIFGVDLPRIVWVILCGVAAYLFMLTDVLSYLLTALSWQAVLIVAWVAVILVRLVVRAEASWITTGQDPQLKPLVAAWFIASVVGIVAHQQTVSPALATLAPLLTFVIGAAVAGVLIAVRLSRTNPEQSLASTQTDAAIVEQA